MSKLNSLLTGLLLTMPGLVFADTPPKDPCCGVKIFGYIDGSYNYLESDNQFISGNYDRAFDIQEDGFTLQQAALSLAYQPDKGLGGLINVILGRDALATASYGYDFLESDHIGFDILQVYGQYAIGKFTFLAGKFVTIVGVEGIDPTGDTNFSRSLLFAFATPDTHTGFRGTYAWNDKLKFILGINDGWDNIRDFSRGPTFEYGISYNPCSKLALSAQGYLGEERVVSHTASGPKGARHLLDLTASYNATDKLTIAANFDYGTQNNAFLVTGENGNASWIGLAAYLNYKFNDTWRISLRGEDFDDRNGYRTGVEQTIKELTFTIGFAPIKNVELRGETRRDFSNVYSYVDRDSGNPRKIQQSYAIEGIYKFSNS